MFNPYYVLVNKNDNSFSLEEINNSLSISNDNKNQTTGTFFVDKDTFETKRIKNGLIITDKNKDKILKKLLNVPGVMIRDGKQYEDPVYYYIDNNYDDIIIFLIENKKLSINKKDKNNQSLIYHYVELNNEEMISYLLEKGADPDAQNKYSLSPVGLAVELKHTESLSLLLEKANPNVKTSSGNHILYEAVMNRDFVSLEILLKSNTDIFKTTSSQSIEINKIDYPNCFFFFVVSYCRDKTNEQCTKALHLSISYKRSDVERYFRKNKNILRDLKKNSLIYENVYNILLEHNIIL